MWTSLYVLFKAHMHAFLLNKYLGLELLGHVLCICSALIDTSSFPKYLCQFTLPLAVNKNSTCSKWLTIICNFCLSFQPFYCYVLCLRLSLLKCELVLPFAFTVTFDTTDHHFFWPPLSSSNSIALIPMTLHYSRRYTFIHSSKVQYTLKTESFYITQLVAKPILTVTRLFIIPLSVIFMLVIEDLLMCNLLWETAQPPSII